MQKINLNLSKFAKRTLNILLKFLPLIALIVPFTILYFYQEVAFPQYPYMIYPSDVYTDTFETLWKGRAFYIFFAWFACLEIILGWEKLQLKISSLRSVRTLAFILALLFPTIYVIYANFYGLNAWIVDKSYEAGVVEFCDWMPLAIEHLVFAAAFTLIVFLQYGTSGLKTVIFSPILLGVIGILYTIDNVFPYGHFMPFQILTPATATLAQMMLNFLGYETSLSYVESPKYGWTPILTAWDPNNPIYSRAGYHIAWVCSGIESLILYTLFMLIFLRTINLSRIQKVICFIIGGGITYLINILRIVIIFILGINFGADSPEVHRFHDYYGQLISISWIAFYPLIITASSSLWNKIKSFIGSLKSNRCFK
ncbi:hypothetical protein DRO54_00060 [Candidatus Bathyarchaeota archaeon]|nr:MAG: hypothetical protein DRO54_00060 [Candidatus Bathyarchaeota archaeon]